MTEPSITESRDINAPASRIFSILSDPALQPDVDGTGMLQGAVGDDVITKVGDVFYISMTHWDMGNYVMANHVTEFEQDRRIAWEPVVHSHEKSERQSVVGQPGLREWGWQLEPLSEDTTRVTAYFEGRRLPEDLRRFIGEGEFWRPAMVTSLENLDRMATQPHEESADIPHSETASQFSELFRGESN
jgi:hypothetical protein